MAVPKKARAFVRPIDKEKHDLCMVAMRDHTGAGYEEMRDALTKSELKLVAAAFREAAENVNETNAPDARAYNLYRAKFIEYDGPAPGSLEHFRTHLLRKKDDD